MITDRHATVAEGLAKLPGPEGERWAIVLEHGTLEVEVYAPRGTDPQKPHTRDELYVVVTGHGEFVNGANRARFAPGDVLFVPAGVPHRFEDFSDDLVVWVMFYGPEGGEAGMASSPQVQKVGMTIRRALGYTAALPVSAAAAAMLPFVVATGGRVRVRDGVVEAEGGLLGPVLARGNPWFPIAAITLGHVVLAVDARALESTRAHERIHVRQYERFGALFPLLYLASSLRAIAVGGRAYGDNAFEKEACARSAGTAAA